MEYSNCTDGQLRLSNGTAAMQGRVEICYNHVWFGVCPDSYSNYYHSVTVCKILGYSEGKYISGTGESNDIVSSCYWIRKFFPGLT